MGAFKRRPSPYGEGPTSVARANVPVLQVLLALSVGLHTGYCPAWKGVRKAKWSGRGLRFNLGKHSADPNPNHHLAWAGLRRMNGPRHSWGGFTVLGDPMFKGDRQTRDYPSGLADSGFPSNWLGVWDAVGQGHAIKPQNPNQKWSKYILHPQKRRTELRRATAGPTEGSQAGGCLECPHTQHKPCVHAARSSLLGYH